MRETKLRWSILTLASILLIGYYFCYDSPAPLKTALLAPPYNLSENQWSGLYSIYSLPNMVLPLLGGILISKIGIRLGLILFTVILTLGQAVLALGGYQNSYAVMMMGRFIFGLGGDSMAVAEYAIVCSWFVGKELSFAVGVY